MLGLFVLSHFLFLVSFFSSIPFLSLPPFPASSSRPLFSFFYLLFLFLLRHHSTTMSRIYPSPVPSRRSVPVPYTASPLKLLWSDIILCLSVLWVVPGVFFPLTPWRSKELDETYPASGNVFAIAVHSFLLMVQSLFVLSIPLCAFSLMPFLWFIVYVAAFVLVNYVICMVTLNGPSQIRLQQSNVNSQECMQHRQEDWIFINGIAVG